MLKLLNRQALKALRNPFRSPLPNPLCGTLQTRHLYTEPVPFAGPPSYATLAQRFSASSPSPISFFGQKREKEAVERGEFVDVHDIGGWSRQLPRRGQRDGLLCHFYSTVQASSNT
jgi:hypothetical protein